MNRRFSNVMGLPEPIVRAITNDSYDPQADFSVTSLIKPPRIVELERQHEADIVEDVADRLWALIGQVGHTILERAGTVGLKEERVTIYRKLNGEGYNISGKMDLWKERTILDYKFTSVYALREGIKPEWEQQLNLYALLARETGIPVESAKIIAIYRDWSVGEARRNKDWPKQQCQSFNLLLWKPEVQETFLMQRLALHLNARTHLPECSEEERWARPEKWAVMKKGNQRATKLHDTQFNALVEVQNRGAGFYVEHRPGVQTRCLDYCPVAAWCHQFESLDPENYLSIAALKRPHDQTRRTETAD